MGKEIERKFLISGFPDKQEFFRCTLYQSYLMSAEREIRIVRRVIGEELVDKMCVKTSGLLSRTEIEFVIPNDTYEELLETIEEPCIVKDYRKYQLGDHVLQASKVDDKFYYCEVEFISEEEAKAFDSSLIPNLIREVTYEKAFKMKNYWNCTRIEGKEFKAC